MIAIISSTIYPSALTTRDGVRSWNTPESRLEQTQKTIQSLVDCGISDIYLADNSGKNWLDTTDALLKPAKVYVFNHHQYHNKGISELYLLLSILEFIPSNEPIVKISGRYFINGNPFQDTFDYDLQIKIYQYGLFSSLMSTRCYWVKNKEIYELFLRQTLRESFAYPSRIIGFGSLARIIYNSIFPGSDEYPYDDPKCSIELASARVLKIFKYKKFEINVLGIEGLVAGNRDDVLNE
jgi:hypothetical protein